MVYDRFYYSVLNSREKAVYKKLYDAISALEKSVAFSIVQSAGISFEKICHYIALDNPHFFYVDFGRFEFWKYPLKVEIHMRYWYDSDGVTALNEKSNTVLSKMLKRVYGNTDYEKALSVHDLLISNVLYDDKAIKNLVAHSPRSNTMLGVLFYKSAVCEGISKTVKMLLNLIDIKCIVAFGKSRINGEPHAWNIVKLDGNPYHLDVTWDLQGSEKDMFRHDYCFLTDDDANKDHEWDVAYPPCLLTEHNYFTRNGLNAHSMRELEGIFCSSLQKGISTLGVKCCFETSSGDVLRAADIAGERIGYSYGRIEVLINADQNVFTVRYI